MGHEMRMPLTKYTNTALTTVIVPLTLSSLCLLLLERLGIYIVNMFTFYFLQDHRVTDRSLELQEFSLCNPTTSTIFAVRFFPHSPNPESDTFLPRLQFYVSI